MKQIAVLSLLALGAAFVTQACSGPDVPVASNSGGASGEPTAGSVNMGGKGAMGGATQSDAGKQATGGTETVPMGGAESAGAPSGGDEQPKGGATQTQGGASQADGGEPATGGDLGKVCNSA